MPPKTIRARLAFACLLASIAAWSLPGTSVAGTRPASTRVGDPIPCIGDGHSGKRVEVIYAHAADVPSRYASKAPKIRGWVSYLNDIVNSSAAETRGTRQVRFVTQNCRLKVDNVQLPNKGDDSEGNLMFYLNKQGYGRVDRKYLVYVDSSTLCLCAAIGGQYAIVANWGWGLTDEPTETISAETHELFHALGAVQSSAPHATAGGHCFDKYDTICYDDGSGSPPIYRCPYFHLRLLDCLHDDYFSTHPPKGSYLAKHINSNTANSPYLAAGLPPPNDAFARAGVLKPTTSAKFGSTIGASAEKSEPRTTNQKAGKSVWYRLKAPMGGGALTVDTQFSEFDTVLGIYKGPSLANLHVVKQNDNYSAGPRYSRVSFPTVPGTTYYIKVDGKRNASGVNASGTLVMHVGFGAPAPDITGFSPTSGPVGTPITIDGTNLAAAGVDFNGVTAGLNDSTSPTQIVVKVPPGAISGPIELVDPNGGYDSADSSFTVTP